MKGYLASHFFNLGGLDFTSKLADIIRKEGIDLYLPQENGEINDKKSDQIVTDIDIWNGDINKLKAADILFACIDGVEIDSGVAGEIGYFNSMIENSPVERLVIGIYTDMRMHGTGEGHHYINLFIQGGINKNGVMIKEDNWTTLEKRIREEIQKFKNKRIIY